MAKTKLTQKQRGEILKKFRTGHYTKVGLALDYNTSARTVGRIVGKGLPEERKPAKPVNPPLYNGLVLGDLVSGHKDYAYTNENAVMEVVEFGATSIKVKILSSTDSSEIGGKYWVYPSKMTKITKEFTTFEEGDLVQGVEGTTHRITGENAVCEVVGMLGLRDATSMQVKLISTTNKYHQHYRGVTFSVLAKHFKKVGKVEQVVEAPVVEKEPLVAYTITAMAISLTVDGTNNVIDCTHANFAKARKAILDNEIALAVELMNVSKAITKFSEGQLTIDNGEVLYEGEVLQGALVDKIINLMGDGKSEFKAFALFLARVLENPSFKARQRLMEFAAANDIGIHTDGRLVAFKNVNEDGCSSRGGKWVEKDGKWVHDDSQRYFHEVGEVLTMPRNKVDDNESNTCSSGLHVCSAYYLKSMWGTKGKTFKVAVCPSDIVAIPPDYKNSKARTCKYEVIEDVSGTEIEEVLQKI